MKIIVYLLPEFLVDGYLFNDVGVFVPFDNRYSYYYDEPITARNIYDKS